MTPIPRRLCSVLFAMCASVACGDEPPASRRISLQAAAGARVVDVVTDFSLLTQSGMSLQSPAGEPLKLAAPLELRELGFWETVRRLEDAGGLTWTWDPNQLRTMRFVRRTDQPRMPLAINELLLIRARTQWRGTIDGRRLLRLNLLLDVEPDRSPFFGSLASADLKLMMGDTALTPFSPEAVTSLRFAGQHAEAAVDWVLSQPVSQRTCDVEGRVKLRIALGRELLTFTLPADSQPSRTVGSNTLRVVNWRNTPAGSEVKLEMVSHSPLVWESHQQTLLHRDAWLTTSQGTRIPVDTLESQPVADGREIVCFRFPTLPLDATDIRFCYSAAVDIRDVDVPWKIANVDVHEPAAPVP